MESPLIEVHRAAGARIAEFGGCPLAESFSQLERECRAARESVALFDSSWHATLKLTGRDRVKYLHAITSNNIQALEIGRGTLALLLNPQGHILAELEIYVLAESVLVRTHVSARERTVATLKKFVIASDVKIEDATDTTGSLAVEGPRAAMVVEQACGVKLQDLPGMAVRDVTVDGIACQLVRREHFGEAGAEIVAPGGGGVYGRPRVRTQPMGKASDSRARRQLRARGDGRVERAATGGGRAVVPCR